MLTLFGLAMISILAFTAASSAIKFKKKIDF